LPTCLESVAAADGATPLAEVEDCCCCEGWQALVVVGIVATDIAAETQLSY